MYDKQGKPIGVLKAFCAGWPSLCKQSLDRAGCVQPEVRYCGAAIGNGVNATQRDECEQCTGGAAPSLRTAGCGTADMASFCFSAFPAVPEMSLPASS